MQAWAMTVGAAKEGEKRKPGPAKRKGIFGMVGEKKEKEKIKVWACSSTMVQQWGCHADHGSSLRVPVPHLMHLFRIMSLRHMCLWCVLQGVGEPPKKVPSAGLRK